MAYRIEIISTTADTRAQVRRKLFDDLFPHRVKKVRLIDVYTIEKKLSVKQIKQAAALLSNPVSQIFRVIPGSSHTKIFPKDPFDWAIEVGFLPGVTDNIATTAKEMLTDTLKTSFQPNEGVYTSQVFFITGKLSKSEIMLLGETIANRLIQRISVKNYELYLKENGMDIVVPQVKLENKARISEINLDVDDSELEEIGKLGILDSDGTRRGPLALDLPSMKTIQTYFKKVGRLPTDVELESLAQTWSEHCKHTIFANSIDQLKSGLYKSYIKAATQQIRRKAKSDICVSVFTDNAGSIIFDDQFCVTHKVETHNSPSALDPFGGAVTGIVGVNRDTIGFGLGAKPVINTYGFCLARPKSTQVLYKDSQLNQKMLSPARIETGVIAGVNAGGNCSGIPTPQGFVYYDDSYQGKPLVFVGTVGLIPHKSKGLSLHQKQAQVGDYVVMVGGRVGLDGIHGATFSSVSLDSGSPATAVQIGDPITQKKLSDALIKEARDLHLYNSITDNGAGGLSCSVAEMAKEAGGCLVQLEKVPLKYPGLEPWQIWISESQERMTLAVPKNKWRQLYKLLLSRGVEATIIGEFTETGRCQVTYKKETVVDLTMEFLHDGLPSRHLQTVAPKVMTVKTHIPKRRDFTIDLLHMMARPNVASFRHISQQYDHEVQGGSVLKPLQGRGRVNSVATVVRPRLDSSKAVVISQGLNPRYSVIDPYRMAACAIDTAIRNVVSVGGNPDYLALLDNFCWCSSNDPERLWQLKQAAQACYDFATAYKTPFISGKDSMFNDFRGFTDQKQLVNISILPTLLISSLSVIPDSAKTVSLDFKFSGDLIYVLGETHDELGGSEYYAHLNENSQHRYEGEKVPQVDSRKNRKLYKIFYQAVQQDLIAAAVSVSLGGVATALGKMAVGGLLGMNISLQHLVGTVTTDIQALFSESQGRLIVSINPTNQKSFEKMIKGLPWTLLGTVSNDDKIQVKGVTGKAIIKVNVEDVHHQYQQLSKSNS